MKRTTTTFLAALMVTGTVVAQTGNRAVDNSDFKRPANTIQKHAITVDPNKAPNTETVFLDYWEYDAQFYTMEQFVTNMNMLDTAQGEFARVFANYDTIVGSTDFVTFTPYTKSTITNMTVDSIFFVLHHQNNDGLTDTLTMRIYGMGSDQRPDLANILWEQKLLTDTSLTGPPSSTGYPISVISEAPNFTMPAGVTEFAVALDFRGAVIDTVMMLFGYPTLGNVCGTPDPMNPSPTLEPVLGEFFPSASYQVVLDDTVGVNGGATSITIPFISTQTNDWALYWFFDCNENQAVDYQTENPYQHWGIWSKVTVTYDPTLNVSDQAMQGEASLAPNPASEATRLSFELQQAAEVSYTIVDLAGRTVASKSLGQVAAGNVSEEVSLSGLTNGVYFMNLNAGGQSSILKFIVKQ